MSNPPKMYEENGEWYIESDLHGKQPVKAFGIRHKNGIADFLYLRDKIIEDELSVDDYKVYFVQRSAAVKNRSGFTHRDSIEIGVKKIHLKNLRPSPKASYVMFIPLKNQERPVGIKVR